MFSYSGTGKTLLLTGICDGETEHRGETIPTVPGSMV